MTDRQILVQELILDEGRSNKPYQDTRGKWSIGTGRNLTDKGLSDLEIMVLLSNDIDEVIADLSTFAWFPPLDPVRQRAVVNLRFNVGHSGFRLFHKFIAAMATKNYPAASDELKNSLWAHQVQPDRVARLRNRMETGED